MDSSERDKVRCWVLGMLSILIAAPILLIVLPLMAPFIVWDAWIESRGSGGRIRCQTCGVAFHSPKADPLATHVPCPECGREVAVSSQATLRVKREPLWRTKRFASWLYRLTHA